MSDFVADLQDAMENVYPGDIIVSQSDPNNSASINGAVGNWTRVETGWVGNMVQGADDRHYSSSSSRYLYFREWDESASECILEWAHALDGPAIHTLSWDGTNFSNGAGFTLSPPSGFSFTGVYSPNLGSQIIIQPNDSSAEFHIYTDNEMRNEDNAIHFSANTRNLQSANALINNTGARAPITQANPFQTTINDWHPLKALHITTNVPINSQSSSGQSNILKRILLQSDEDIYVPTDNDMYIDVVGQQNVSALSFKLVDLYGNAINLGGKNMSFSFVIKQ